ncbi:MAG TPA: flavin reductase family protein [Gemmatimonadales bacterium]|jgi:flavin reductase (DIM6/NTAB) family NADH-FMN oxidoreductase RutF|nr:flavin reductase family protein [Gemmatimonadales bacterium]
MTGVDAALFRQLLGRFATGVTVITTRNPAGEPEGMTASSVASVSLDPPLLLVSVDHQNVMHEALARASHFVVNILAADQEALSRRFAELEENRFDGVGFHTSQLGLPILDGVVAHLECARDAVVPAGDHTVYFGLVTGGVVTDRRPLLYYRGGYANLSGG